MPEVLDSCGVDVAWLVENVFEPKVAVYHDCVGKGEDYECRKCNYCKNGERIYAVGNVLCLVAISCNHNVKRNGDDKECEDELRAENPPLRNCERNAMLYCL